MHRPIIREVAVLGAGTMGSQISYTCAVNGYQVRLLDQAPAARDTARAKQREWAAREIPGPGSDQALLARISYHASLEQAVADADLVIEALPEDLELKRRTFARLDALCPARVILASTSSSLRMSRIETDVKNRERVCNLHFFQRPASRWV